MQLIERMEKITTAWRPEGEWITSVDLMEEAGGRLAVREMGRPGVCGVECKTVERAAEQIMGEHDTDVAEALFTVGWVSWLAAGDATAAVRPCQQPGAHPSRSLALHLTSCPCNLLPRCRARRTGRSSPAGCAAS